MFCRCKKCKGKKRKGLVLGASWAHHWVNGGLMKLSGYVPYHKWKKGRVRKDTNQKYRKWFSE